MQGRTMRDAPQEPPKPPTAEELRRVIEKGFIWLRGFSSCQGHPQLENMIKLMEERFDTYTQTIKAEKEKDRDAAH